MGGQPQPGDNGPAQPAAGLALAPPPPLQLVQAPVQPAVPPQAVAAQAPNPTPVVTADDVDAQRGEQPAVAPGSSSRHDQIQVGSRVSTPASTFDGPAQAGLRWSIEVFGADGTGKRLYGNVTGTLARDVYSVQWDIGGMLPRNDPSRTANRGLGVKTRFPLGLLRKEEPRAGLRPTNTPDESSPRNRPSLSRETEEGKPDDADGMDPAEVADRTAFREQEYPTTDEEDADWDGNDSADESGPGGAAPAAAASGSDDDDAPPDPTELLLIMKPYTVDGGRFKPPDKPAVDVKWTFTGHGDELDEAALPWTLKEPGAGGDGAAAASEPSENPHLHYGAASNPAEDRTDFDPSLDVPSLTTELEQFLLMWPGGLEGAMQHTQRLNEMAASHEHKWTPIDVWDWLGFLCIILAKTQHDCSVDDLFNPEIDSASLTQHLFAESDFGQVMSRRKFDAIRKSVSPAAVWMLR